MDQFRQDGDGVDFHESGNDMVVRVALPEGITRAKDVAVSIKGARELYVDYATTASYAPPRAPLLAGLLHERVRDHLWTIEDGHVVIEMTKQIRGGTQMWSRVFERIDVGKRRVVPKPRAEEASSRRAVQQQEESASPVRRTIVTTVVLVLAAVVFGYIFFKP